MRARLHETELATPERRRHLAPMWPTEIRALELLPAGLLKMMKKKKNHGKTRSGVPIDEELTWKLAAEAEDGYDARETLRRRGGRPTIGAGPASVESVRLDPELRSALASRAERDHEARASVIRKALRAYLKVG